MGSNEYEQTKQIFTRIKRICEAAGGSLEDIVKMTIYMVDIKNNTEVWRARREFFSGDFPASTLVEVRSLAGPETLVEIETDRVSRKNIGPTAYYLTRDSARRAASSTPRRPSGSRR